MPPSMGEASLSRLASGGQLLAGGQERRLWAGFLPSKVPPGRAGVRPIEACTVAVRDIAKRRLRSPTERRPRRSLPLDECSLDWIGLHVSRPSGRGGSDPRGIPGPVKKPQQNGYN